MFYHIHRAIQSHIGCITLWGTCHIGNCFCKNNLCLRHTDAFYCLCCRNRYIQCHRVCCTNILCRADHDSSCDETDIFSCIQHSCKVIKGCIRVCSTDTFDKCRNRIIMIIACLIIFHYTLLDTFLCHIDCNMDKSVFASWCG